MKVTGASVGWWIFAFLLSISLAVYQRMTGPTYPVRGNIEINNQEIDFRLIRSADSDKPAEIRIKEVSGDLEGQLKFKRYRTHEVYQTINFTKEGNDLVAFLPPEPPAGKLEYEVTLLHDQQEFKLSDDPVVIRFKGVVPPFVLIPHIIFMYLAMWFSIRTGIEAFRKGPNLLQYTGATLIFLLIGGMILGPVVQKYAFDAYWTGWPFGKDLTDNKTLFAFIGWIAAYFGIRRNVKHGWLAVLAAFILIAVYMIPHSMFGSELDYTSGEIGTGE